jgi:nucleotide-binding universal stress UspA family protein
VQQKRSLVRVISPRAEVTPFQVVVTQLDYDAVPVGGSYWFNGQLQKRYWAAPTPTPETPEPIVEFTQKRAVDIEDAASGLTYQVRFKRILVPTDFSESAEQALKYAVRFNDLCHAEIFLLHVFTLPEYVSPLSAKAKVDSEVADDVWEAAKKRALEKLEDIVRRLADKKPALITSLSIGCPFEEIVKFSAERNVDLIVMSTHGRTLRPEVFPDHLYYDLYARFAALRTGYQLGFFDSSANYPGCRRRRSATRSSRILCASSDAIAPGGDRRVPFCYNQLDKFMPRRQILTEPCR